MAGVSGFAGERSHHVLILDLDHVELHGRGELLKREIGEGTQHVIVILSHNDSVSILKIPCFAIVLSVFKNRFLPAIVSGIILMLIGEILDISGLRGRLLLYFCFRLFACRCSL